MHTPDTLDHARAVVAQLVERMDAAAPGDGAAPLPRARADRAAWASIVVAVGLGAGALGVAVGVALGLAVGAADRAPVVVITSGSGT